MDPIRHMSTLVPAPLLAVVAACGLVRVSDGQQQLQPPPKVPAQQTAGQGMDAKIELQELQTTLQVANSRIQMLEKQLASLREQNGMLAQATAAANAETSQLRESQEKLRSLLEGLGIGALENSTDQIQERLLSALSDMRLIDGQKKKVSEALVSLAEASLLFARTAESPDAEAKRALEAALAKGDQVLRAANNLKSDDPSATKSLHEARVVSMKTEAGVAVLDVGSRDGVKPGMPFEIYREDKPVARVLVTDVRRTVSGAVVQELSNPSDSVKVGDLGKVETNKKL